MNSTNVMKREARGTQRPRHIIQIDEEVSTAQRSDSLVQSINQRFPCYLLIFSTGQNIAIDIKPLPMFPHKTADFVQAVGAAVYFVTCDEFHDGMIRIGLFMAFYR